MCECALEETQSTPRTLQVSMTVSYEIERALEMSDFERFADRIGLPKKRANLSPVLFLAHQLLYLSNILRIFIFVSPVLPL